MRAIYATIFLSMFLLNVAWGYTEIDSDDMSPAEKEDMKKIILQVCPSRRSKCKANNSAAIDVARKAENKFSGQWSVVLFSKNGYGASITYIKYYEVDYKGIKWMIFKTTE